MLRLAFQHGRPPVILALGAHPDDIEIGCGGTLLQLADAYPGLTAHLVVFTGSGRRAAEGRGAATTFLPGAATTVTVHALPDGHLPAHWDEVKDLLEGVAREVSPDLIFAPSHQDAHQDHRVVADLVTTVFRAHLVLGYEIPKWDGDLGRPAVYVPLSEHIALRKASLLLTCFPSQAGRDWFHERVFLGLASLRGMECRAPYAEAFSCTKLVLDPMGRMAQGI